VKHIIQLFCKNNVCACMRENVIKPFIELPDLNGNINRNILVPYSLINKSFNYEYKNKTIYISLECKNDFQCFSNKCVNNICTNNTDSDVYRCDSIFIKKI